MTSNDNLLVPTFRVQVIPNETASKSAGRPIFDQMEVVEIRFAGNRQTVAVFPAHDPEPNATRERNEIVTYAMLYNEQYRKFKAMETQDVSGTPLAEAPFLTEAKRRELKALNIHTVEALASLDGTPLRQLGMGGRELKNQATAYLDNARGSADVTALAAQVAALQQQIADRDDLIANYAKPQAKNKYQKGVERSLAKQAEAEAAADRDEAPVPPDDVHDEAEAENVTRATADTTAEKDLEDCTNEELKQYIATETGERVKGNPSHETLVKRALEIATDPARKAD